MPKAAGSSRGGGAAAGPAAPAGPATGSVAAQVERVVDTLPIGVRVTLADIRDRLDGDWDAAKQQLRTMQMEGRVVLIPANEPPSRISQRVMDASIVYTPGTRFDPMGDSRQYVYRIR